MKKVFGGSISRIACSETPETPRGPPWEHAYMALASGDARRSRAADALMAFGGVAPRAFAIPDCTRLAASLDDAALDAEIMELLCMALPAQPTLAQVSPAASVEPAVMLSDLVTADSLGLSSSCSSISGVTPQLQQLGGQLPPRDKLSPASSVWPTAGAVLPQPPHMQPQDMQHMQLPQPQQQPVRPQGQLQPVRLQPVQPQQVQLQVPPAGTPRAHQMQQQPLGAVAPATTTSRQPQAAGGAASAQHSGQQSPISGAKCKAASQKPNYKEARKRTRDRHVITIESLQQQLRASDCTQAELRSQVEALQASQVQLLARLSDLTSRWQETVATNADLHKRNLLLEQRLAVAGGCRPSDSRDDTTAAASSQGQVMHA